MFTYYLSASRKTKDTDSKLFNKLVKDYDAKPDEDYSATAVFKSELVFYKKFKQIEQALKGYHFSLTQKPDIEGASFSWNRSDNNFARDLDRSKAPRDRSDWEMVQGRLEERLSVIGLPIEFEEGWGKQ